MQTGNDLNLQRKKRSLILLGLACFGAGFMNFIQSSVPLREWVWDLLWFLYALLIEFISEPLFKGIKFLKRLALGGLLVAFVLLIYWGLIKLSNIYGIPPAYLTPLPFFAVGIILFAWSMFIHPDVLPQ